MPDEYLHTASIGQIIEGSCGTGGGEEEEGPAVVNPVMGETTVKKLKVTAIKELKGGNGDTGNKPNKGNKPKKGKKPPKDD